MPYNSNFGKQHSSERLSVEEYKKKVWNELQKLSEEELKEECEDDPRELKSIKKYLHKELK